MPFQNSSLWSLICILVTRDKKTGKIYFISSFNPIKPHYIIILKWVGFKKSRLQRKQYKQVFIFILKKEYVILELSQQLGRCLVPNLDFWGKGKKSGRGNE